MSSNAKNLLLFFTHAKADFSAAQADIEMTMKYLRAKSISSPAELRTLVIAPTDTTARVPLLIAPSPPKCRTS